MVSDKYLEGIEESCEKAFLEDNMKLGKFKYFAIDIFIVGFSFLFMAWLKPATKRVVLPVYYKPFLAFLFIWLSISLIGDKFNFYKKGKLSDIILQIIRSDFTILAIIMILMYALNLFRYSRLIVFGTILFSSALEILLSYIFYFHSRITNDDYPSSLELGARFIEPEIMVPRQEYLVGSDDIAEDESILYDLKGKYLFEQPFLFDFLHQHLPLHKIKRSQALILNTHNMFNIQNIEPLSQEFFLNLHKINDVRRINKYFIQVNKNLATGGIFSGCSDTIEVHVKKIFRSYPQPISLIVYIMDFVFRRIFPKLPLFKELYFAISGGVNRALSKAEVLGRLCFCGFKVIAIQELDDSIFFIAQKITEPREDVNPSYGPFIKMKRIGRNREYVYIYKLRTMHPYSEYLQEYIHDRYNLDDSGKFKNDFRITGWGKVFRKLWLDELPQLLNLFRGEVSLVGTRALSEHYFRLYPKEMQDMRCRVKPGLVPPYYADMPESFDDIIASERNYLLKRQKNRFTTDFRYFFRALYNIMFKNARSR